MHCSDSDYQLSYGIAISSFQAVGDRRCYRGCFVFLLLRIHFVFRQEAVFPQLLQTTHQPHLSNGVCLGHYCIFPFGVRSKHAFHDFVWWKVVCRLHHGLLYSFVFHPTVFHEIHLAHRVAGIRNVFFMANLHGRADAAQHLWSWKLSISFLLLFHVVGCKDGSFRI